MKFLKEVIEDTERETQAQKGTIEMILKETYVSDARGKRGGKTKPSQDGESTGTNLTHPEVGVSDKGYQPPRDVAQVKVRFTARDIEHLSDCDDTVRDLLERAQSVELTFSYDDLEWVRENASAEANGWGQSLETPDVSTKETKIGNDLIITMEHKRGL